MWKTATSGERRGARVACALLCFSVSIAMAESAASQVNMQNLSGPAAGKWHTWSIPSGSSIAVQPPPETETTRAETNELKSRMAHDAETMSRIAYWDRGWPGYRWQEIALAESRSASKEPLLPHTMAIVASAIHDATVATWHAKYEFGRARPSHTDPSIVPLVAVPRSPSYPSEHAAVAAAAADVLSYIFPKSAARLAQRADGAAQSRVAAGLQYPSDVQAGLALGHEVGKAVIARVKVDRSDVP